MTLFFPLYFIYLVYGLAKYRKSMDFGLALAEQKPAWLGTSEVNMAQILCQGVIETYRKTNKQLTKQPDRTRAQINTCKQTNKKDSYRILVADFKKSFSSSRKQCYFSDSDILFENDWLIFSLSFKQIGSLLQET